MSNRFTALVLALAAGLSLNAQPAPLEEEDPYVIEDGGVSLQTYFWLGSMSPALRPGETATDATVGSLDIARKMQGSGGFTFSVPAGKQNTVRITYERSGRSGDFVASGPLSIFSVGYTDGDYLLSDYKLQHVKVSLDYLSYTWGRSKLRFKTLWEVHYASAEVTLDAPLKEMAIDSDGAYVSNTAWGRKWSLLPALGVGLGQPVSKRFRWEAKISGFGIPRRAALWDAEASAVLRLGNAEVLAGAKAFKVKTTARDDAYFNQTLAGPFIALRWKWGMSDAGTGY